MRRRTWLLGGGALIVGGGVAAALIFGDDEDAGIPVTLGLPRWIAPFLRYTLSGQERLAVLVRRSETETLPAGETRTPASGDRLEIRGYDAASLAPIFAAPIASVATNGAPSATLLGEHAATIWIFADTVGAVSGVDGQVLIERQGLVALTPDIEGVLAQPRLTIWLSPDGLMLQTPTGPRRFNPRSLRAEPMTAAGEALPSPRGPGRFELRATTAFRTNEARIGDTWFGLAPTNAPPSAGTRRPNIPGARFFAGTGQPGTSAQRLWRATLATSAGAAAAPSADAGFQSTARTPAPPVAAPTALRLDAPTALPFEPGSLGQAGFLTQGTQPDSEPVRPPGAPGLLILHRAADGTLGLTRINAQGALVWTAALPLDRLISSMPGDGPLVLAGITNAGAEALVAVALDTGAVTTRLLAE
ncbi:MAG: hypothetical protein V4653_01280 [Pseudomonadota bacterium]